MLRLAAAPLLLIGLAAGPPAQALEPPLTHEEAAGVVAANRDFAPLLEKYQHELEAWAQVHQREVEPGQDPCKLPAEAASAPGYAEMIKVIRRHGFDDGEQFCRSNLRVIATCGAIEADQENPDWRANMATRNGHADQFRTQVAEARREIEASTALSAEQKQQMLAQLEQAVRGLAPLTDNPLLAMLEHVTPADQAVARSHCAELGKVFEARDHAPSAPPPSPSAR